MKRRTEEIFRRIIAAVLIIALLPFSDFQNCLSVKARELESPNVSEEFVEPETPDISEEATEPETPDISEESAKAETVKASRESADEKENWTLSEDYTLSRDSIVDGLVLTDGTLDLNGCSLTVQGDLIQAGGVLFVNGGALTVEGDYLLLSKEAAGSAGLLRMTVEEDKVCVMGDFISESNQDSTDALTAGVLEVRGDISIRDTYSGKSFVASRNHTLLLNGHELQTVNFAGSAPDQSRISNLEITNTSGAGVIFENTVDSTGSGSQQESAPCVTGNVNDNGSSVSGFIAMVSGTTFEEGYFGGSVYIGSELSLDSVLTIGGDCRVNVNADIPISGNVTVKGNLLQNKSRLRMEQGSLIVEGDYKLFYSLYSRLQMTHEQDSVHVYGDVEFNPYHEGNMSLTAGTFEVGGDFSSTRGVQATCFIVGLRSGQVFPIA